MKTHQVLFALGALMLLSTFAIAEARRKTDAETCSAIRDSAIKADIAGSLTVQALTYQQRLDHYNHQDDRTWTQRYWVEDRYWSGADANGPIFLQLGGEGPESPGIVTSYAMSMYAVKHKALQVGIEHRYYGLSQPFPTLTTDNLQWLSSQQALADAAELILKVRDQYKAYNSPIITFGCSYSGALAAFFRIKYPHITLASVASSSPVEAMLDFHQYLEVVQNSLTYFSGRACADSINTATQSIQTMLKTPSGRTDLQNRFKVCKPLDSDLDRSTFMQNLMGNWQGIVQYNNEGPQYNVTSSCARLASNIKGGMDVLSAYVEVTNHFWPSFPCLDCSYTNMVAETQDTSTSGSMRQWTYQTCTEFAYFQTTDSALQPFGNMVPVEYWIQFCKDVYGKDFQPALKVKETNEHYGGFKLPTFITNNILFVNGNIDPWHSLSIYEPIANSPLQTVFVDGTAHCADVSLTGSRAPPQLQAAQGKVSDIIGQWVANYKPLAPTS